LNETTALLSQEGSGSGRFSRCREGWFQSGVAQRALREPPLARSRLRLDRAALL